MRPDSTLVAIVKGEPVTLDSSRVSELLDQAVEHRVLGSIRNSLNSGRLEVKEEAAVHSFLTAQELRIDARTKKHMKAARHAIKLLQAAGCDVAVFKGSWSMHVLYDRPTDRVTSDLDLFVEPSWRTRHSDIANLFLPTETEPDKRDSQGNQPGIWTFSTKDLDVDLHTNPFGTMFELDNDTLHHIWNEHTTKGEDFLSGARVPSLELALTQALINYCKDRYAWLFQMEEVRRLTLHPDLDWDRFDRLVELAGTKRVVDASLHSVAETFDLRIANRAGKPSPLLLPWTAPRMTLRGRRSRWLKGRRLIFGLLTFDSWRTGLTKLRQWFAPDATVLGAHLRAVGERDDRGYWHSLASLTVRRAKRLTPPTSSFRTGKPTIGRSR